MYVFPIERALPKKKKKKMDRSIEITPRGFHWGRIFCLPFLEKSRALTFELLIVLKYF